MLVSTRGHHKRMTVAATTVLACACACATLPTATLAAAGPGGTASPGSPSPPGSSSPGSPSRPGSPSSSGSPSSPSSPSAIAPGASAPAHPTRNNGRRASLHVLGVRITAVSCVPVPRCSTNPRQVSIHGTLLVGGVGLRAGMIVAFPSAPGARISRVSPAGHLRQTTSGLLVTVPSSAHSGRIMVLLGGGRYTSVFGPIYVVKHALHPPSPPRPAPAPTQPTGGAVAGSPFEGQGMWIWYVSQSNGGNVASIVARAQAAGVRTLFVKSSDGSSNYWGQFNPQLVAELHAAGLKVCGWQYVYGSNPKGEAALGAEAAANGADCLVIDAEAEYEGRYGAAQTYMRELRAKVGPGYPIGLASFPYVSYHPSEPYSVFLGPGGAQYDAPQMYWHAIGVSVDTVYANTWIANRIYGRPIFPLGQTYESVSYSDLVRFREEAVDYGASGWSFWDWQETASRGWQALAAPLAPLGSVTPNAEYPELSQGIKGDQVLWLQEHLASAISAQEVTGIFGSKTTANLRAFQSAHSLPASGVADPATWTALLALAPVEVSWTGGGPSG